MILESFEILRVLALAALASILASFGMPALIRMLKAWKMGKSIRDDGSTPIFSKLHAKKAGTPTMGGLSIWGTVVGFALILALLATLFPDSLFARFNFLSRSETLLPLGVLAASAIVGLVDDWLNVRRVGPGGGGLRMRHRMLIYIAIAAVGAWWFATKLEWDILHIPFYENVHLGWWYSLFFMFVMIATSFSVNETDGLDGLAGGTLLTSFGAYALIAFAQGKFDLAVFCGVILGALLAFLWFNVHPARVFMGDTGSMSLGVTLGLVAMLTNTPLLLPLIGLVFVLESLSVILQLASKKLRKKKLFLSSPFHHHLEARGWEESTIVMRAWLVSIVAASLGVAVALLDGLI